ncbi:polysaccharide pyruvyl transferase family protein [Desulforamulus aquiferis]|uniref:Polysaccharide pyruvyl transferase family protein n=1 Tax=Desulforamulus aquiferis TaxID=1397668 RepID=A0AAW7ZC59_9FIRM|nr:polysaccharide pyruvyl transferase family protein [Desulforamulus aquiferis]MDO7786868.1 polysaccharide pyruvyl transferase family protein [Desulforamulus aquiferis]
MIKKIGIMTLYHKNYNFGGQLQAYALQKELERLDFESEVIDCELASMNGIWDRFRYLGLVQSAKIFKKKIGLKLRRLNPKFRSQMVAREIKFREFANSIPHSPFCTVDTVRSCTERYDYFITGSDQVWNPGLWRDALFLNFVPPGKKRISYAASIGVPRLSDDEKAYMGTNLNHFHAVSVREIGTKKLIEGFWKGKISITLDPTLLFDKKFWDGIAIQPMIKEPYVFVYMIGSNEHTKKNVYDFCCRSGIRMVSVPHTQGYYKPEDEQYSDILAYDIGPCEWIGLIRNATYVFTDSFHGTAFSVNYNKNFWCFEPKVDKDVPTGSLRIESLLLQLGLQDRILQFKGNLTDNQLSQPINYNKSELLLDALRQDSRTFLVNAIK